MSPARLLCPVLIFLTLPLATAETPPFLSWAERPVMGWNSWDFYGTTVNEGKTKAQADYMAANLSSHGWNLITVDIQWYEPNASGFDYDPNATLVMDQWGRLTPAVNRFPSAANGAGFKPLADYVHSKGLKFGIHMMRGIPRQAWQQGLPVKGTAYTARDIADVNSTCSWNPDMYGVDMSKPGAQAYYDSLLELVASWGVDFVKIDDLSRPYHLQEIEAIRHAIDRTGRPIVFSTSPGETPVDQGPHVMSHANQWRISDDFWDSWSALAEQFQRLHDWTPYRGPGHFPDADMLPLGKLHAGDVTSTGRSTYFTASEQYTMMSLWAIARSPLIHGSDMTQMDSFTLALLTNDEVLAVNQRSSHNRQLFRSGNLVAWVADADNSTDKYLAVFNTGSGSANVPVTLSTLGFTGSVQIRSLWNRTALGAVSSTFSPAIASHGAALYRLSGVSLPTPWITDANADDGKVTISWESLPSATSYRIQRSIAETGPFEIIADALNETAFVDTSVANGTTYFYAVSATVSGQQTPASGVRSATPAGRPQIVSWNYDRYGTVAGTARAGLVPAVNWNNSWPDDPRSNLIDSSGNPTTLDLSYSSYNTWSIQASGPALDSDGASNKRLLNGYLNAGPASWDPSPVRSSVTLSQIPHPRYDLIVYFSSNEADREGQVTDGRTTYFFRSIGPASISGANAALVKTTQTVSTAYPAANCAVFAGLTGASQTVSVQMRDNDEWGGIAALQVIPKATPPLGAYAYWPFDEAGGSTAVDGWGDRTGTLVGGASFGSGAFGHALHFDPASQGHLVFPAGVAASLGDFTVAAWVNLTTVAAEARIFDFGTGAGNTMFLTPQDSGTGRPRFSITTGGAATAQNIESAMALPTGGWHHLAVTRSGQTGCLYLDGALVGTNSTLTLSPADLGATTKNYLGRSQKSSDPYLDGSLDDFRIYDRALSLEEISALPAPVAAPQHVVATSGPLEISLSWDAVAGATSYTVRSSSAGVYTVLAFGLTSPGFVHSNLTFGQGYSYVVTAVNSQGSSFGSEELAASPLSPLISREESLCPTLAIDQSSARITTASPTVSGHTYQLQSRADLTSGAWIDAGLPMAGTGEPCTFEVALPPTARRQFYRIVVGRE